MKRTLFSHTFAFGLFIPSKVHIRKGRTLFIVYVKSSKTKVGHLRNKIKIFFFTFSQCFFIYPSPPLNKLVMLILKKEILYQIVVFYVPWVYTN